MLATPISHQGKIPLATRRKPATSIRDWAVASCVLLIAAAFLFLDARPMPILLWDESRNIVNALEMDRAGFSLITTYQGAADLWNTKPPLMVWLMVASIRVFDASEWSLRLPGMLAALGTLAVVMVFVRRNTGSIWTAAFAAMLLVISPAWLGEHGARTADYDSLLTFFITAYLAILFGALHRTRADGRQLALFGICVVGAVLTKSAAGVIPGAGAALYIVFVGRAPRLWRSWGWLAAGAAIVAAIGIFLLLREMQAPGYLAASWYNDVGGRFSEALETAPKPITFYVADIWAGYFSAPLLVILSLLTLRWMSPRSRFLTIYCLSIVAVFLLVISLAASKLHHYILPILPFMAIAAALTFRTIILRLIAAMRTAQLPARLTAIALTLITIVPLIKAGEGAFARRYLVEPTYEGAASRNYAALFDQLAGQRAPLTVVDPGIVRGDKLHYAPVLLAYREIWQRRGVTIGWATGFNPATVGIIASCDPETAHKLLIQSKNIASVPDCAAILRH